MVTVHEPSQSPLVRDISDTARWSTWCRAVESERPDAHFNDYLAKRLAGDRGPAIEQAMSRGRGALYRLWSFGRWSEVHVT